MNKPKNNSSNFANSLKKYAPLAALLGTVIGATSYVRDHIDSAVDRGVKPLSERVATLQTQIDSNKTDLTKLRSAIEALTSRQGTETRDLVHRLLTSAARSSAPVQSTIVDAAATLTNSLTGSDAKAPASFFRESVTQVNSLLLADPAQVYQLRVALANYRSAQLPLPSNISAHAIAGETFDLNRDYVPDKERTTLEFQYATERDEMLAFSGHVLNGKTVMSRVTGVNIVSKRGNAKQVLDYVHWSDVDIVNAHVIYRGGPVTLHNVRFIHCTFEIAPAIRNAIGGKQLLEYATLEGSSLELKG